MDQRASFREGGLCFAVVDREDHAAVAPGAPGSHLCEVSLPPDGLEQDDRFYLTIPVMEKEEVLIVSDDPNPDKDAVYFLKTALNPYDKLQGSLLPRHIGSGESPPPNLLPRKSFS